jgi:hypothetical protein
MFRLVVNNEVEETKRVYEGRKFCLPCFGLFTREFGLECDVRNAKVN